MNKFQITARQEYPYIYIWNSWRCTFEMNSFTDSEKILGNQKNTNDVTNIKYVSRISTEHERFIGADHYQS